MNTIQERIKSLRMEGETQVQFAERLGTTQASISRYVNGRQPDRETLLKIAERTGASLDWLLTGREGSGEGAADPLDSALQSIARLNGISPEEKELLRDLVFRFVSDSASREAIASFWKEQPSRTME